MSTEKITFLMNLLRLTLRPLLLRNEGRWKGEWGSDEEKLTRWNTHATPYHAPVCLAQKFGYFDDEGIKVALLEPDDPSGLSPYPHRAVETYAEDDRYD